MKTLRILTTLLAVTAIVMVAGCGDDGTSPGNRRPSLTGLAADPGTVDPSGVATVTCTASDPDGDQLTYTWSAEDGVLEGSGPAVIWTAPMTEGDYAISVAVEDGQGHTTSDSTEVTVRGATLLVKTRDAIAAVGMDGTHFVLKPIPVEVEVLGTRIFIGPSDWREIDYTGQVIGGPGTPEEVTRTTSFTMLPDGSVAFTENWTDSVFFVSAEGQVTDAVQLPEASSINQFMIGLVVGNDLIISETGSYKLARIDLATHAVSIFKDLSQLDAWLGDLEYLDGTFYMTQWQSLFRFTETGNPVEIAHFEDGSILGVAVFGTSAFVASRDEGRIYRIDLPTETLEVFAEGLNDPRELEHLPVGLTAP